MQPYPCRNNCGGEISVVSANIISKTLGEHSVSSEGAKGAKGAPVEFEGSPSWLAFPRLLANDNRLPRQGVVSTRRYASLAYIIQ